MVTSSRLRVVALGIAAAGLRARLAAATFTVTTTGDSGAGSLRQAILDSNVNPGADDIAFAIPGSGVHTIQLSSPLPEILDPVFIDGYTQPGSATNTNPPGQGFNTIIQVEIKGTGNPSAPCLTVSAGNSGMISMVVQGLAINRCSDAILVTAGGSHAWIRQNFIGTDASGNHGQAQLNGGIDVQGATGVLIASNLVSGGGGIALNGPDAIVVGNLVGTNAAGDAAVPNAGYGIGFGPGCGSTTIGGTTPDARNVVSGNSDGIDGGCTTVQVLGNFVGTDVTGTRPLGNSHTGISLTDSGTVNGNVISANDVGLSITRTSPVFSVVEGNFIGTDTTATRDLGNRSNGILIGSAGDVVIGGTGPGEGNVIAHNGFHKTPNLLFGGGIYVTGGSVAIRGNRIFDNWPLGIDLAGLVPGVTPNDPGDEDITLDGLTLQNFPMIASVVPGASTTHVEGTLNSKPLQPYDIDLYAGETCTRRPWDSLQAETYLGSLQVVTDGFGNASFSVDVPLALAPGQPVTATATDESVGVPLNTSEFSQRLVLGVDPRSGPGGGGTAVTISGIAFEPGPSVTVGGSAASNVVAVDPQTITATMPAFPAGTLHNVTVAVPSGLAGTLKNGWLADFADVPSSNQFHDFVARLVVDGVAAGVGSGNYGVNQSTLRQQMAVFLLKGKHGVCYVPPPCTGTFADVPCPSQFADWIEALADEGITGGCGGGDYCPQNPVRRDQMAAFLLKAEHGSDYVPPACAGTFDDVTCPSLFADWIEQLAAEQITGGCGNANYCPGSNATRGQMAAFVSKTFQLP